MLYTVIYLAQSCGVLGNLLDVKLRNLIGDVLISMLVSSVLHLRKDRIKNEKEQSLVGSESGYVCLWTVNSELAL